MDIPQKPLLIATSFSVERVIVGFETTDPKSVHAAKKLVEDLIRKPDVKVGITRLTVVFKSPGELLDLYLSLINI